MAKVIRFDRIGGPEVLYSTTAEVGRPGPGQVRLRHVAVGLNYADTYFRNGTYPIPLPNGIGVEAAGIVEEVGEGVTNVVAGDRVTYTGFTNTLGAYSTERLIDAATLIRLPEAISLETAAADFMAGRPQQPCRIPFHAVGLPDLLAQILGQRLLGRARHQHADHEAACLRCPARGRLHAAAAPTLRVMVG